MWMKLQWRTGLLKMDGPLLKNMNELNLQSRMSDDPEDYSYLNNMPLHSSRVWTKVRAYAIKKESRWIKRKHRPKLQVLHYKCSWNPGAPGDLCRYGVWDMETGSGRERWTTEVLEKSDSETIKPCSGHSAFSEGCIE